MKLTKGKVMACATSQHLFVRTDAYVVVFLKRMTITSVSEYLIEKRQSRLTARSDESTEPACDINLIDTLKMREQSRLEPSIR